nr:hypothetical protein [Tanacetum cinerariifolium]
MRAHPLYPDGATACADVPHQFARRRGESGEGDGTYVALGELTVVPERLIRQAAKRRQTQRIGLRPAFDGDQVQRGDVGCVPLARRLRQRRTTWGRRWPARIPACRAAPAPGPERTGWATGDARPECRVATNRVVAGRRTPAAPATARAERCGPALCSRPHRFPRLPQSAHLSCAAHQAEQDAERMSGAYAFINDKKQNLYSFRDSLPNGNGARSKFDLLNPGITPFSIVLPGQLIVVGDESTSMCTPGDNLLAFYARDVRESLIATDHASATVLTQNYDALQSIMNVKRINNVARTLSGGTAIGVALDVSGGLMEIDEACSAGREQQCTKAKFVEVGKMMVGMPVAWRAGAFAGPAAAQLCLRMAGPTRGASIIACGIAGGAIVGWGAGKGAVVSASFLLIGHLLAIYAAYCVLPEIEAQLSRCKLIMDAKSFWGEYSHAGKMYRYSMASMVLTCPRLLDKHGLADLDQVNNMPERLRRWIYMPSRIGGGGLVELRADGWVEQEVAKWGNILVAGCMSWLAMNDGLLGGVVIVSGVISVVSFCLDVYVKYVILPEVEERLKNCRIVIDAKRCWDNAGFVGRRYRLVAVNLALTSTELMRQKSLVDIKDVASISSHQRRWICIPERVAITSFIAGITALAVLGKLW